MPRGIVSITPGDGYMAKLIIILKKGPANILKKVSYIVWKV